MRAFRDLQMLAKRQRLDGRSVSQKNVRFDAHGTQLGRLHLPRQDLRSLVLNRPRALRGPASKRARARDEPPADADLQTSDAPAATAANSQ